MDIYEVVKKLIGPVDPVGDSSIDAERFENLMVLASLVEDLVGDLSLVASGKTSGMGSFQKAGRYSSDFLDDLRLEL